MEENNQQNTVQPVQLTKKKRIKWGRITLITAILLLIILVIPFGSRSLAQMAVDKLTGNTGSDVAATVDGSKITMKDLDKEYALIDPSLQSSYSKGSLLDEIIGEKLLLAEAKKQNIQVSDEEFNTYLKNSEAQLPSGTTLTTIAKSKNLTLAEFKIRLKDQMTLKLFIDKTIMIQNVTEKDALTFYNANKDKLNTSEMVNASHILVATKAEADQIETDLKNGQKFEDIAREKSLDTGTKVNGGNLGFFPKGVMVAEFEATAFNLSVGEISQPIKTQFGYHIIRLDGRKPATSPKFDDIKTQIISYLQSQEIQQKVAKYISDTVTQAIAAGRVKILYSGQ
jgi:foldase protein PrsA